MSDTPTTLSGSLLEQATDAYNTARALFQAARTDRDKYQEELSKVTAELSGNINNAKSIMALRKAEMEDAERAMRSLTPRTRKPRNVNTGDPLMTGMGYYDEAVPDDD